MLNWEKIREIKLLRIRCTNLKKGCEWVGQLEDLRNHLQSDSGCDYEDVKCSNKGYEWEQLRECGKMVERRFVAHHQYHDCSYREYTCGKVDTYDAIAGTRRIKKTMPSLFASVKLFFTSPPPTNHYAMCTYFPLECPNACGERVTKHKEMKTHLEVCPLQPLDCPYKDAGCTHKILRKDMESHIKSSMEEHLMMVFIAQKTHIERLEARIENLEKKKK